MIFLIDDSFTIWVPLMTINKKYFTSSRYPYVLGFDLLIFALTSMLICIAVYIMLRYRKFHTNLRAILMFQMCQWFEIVLARWFLFPYFIGAKPMGDVNTIYKHFWTDNSQLMIPIHSSVLVEEWPLFLGGFLYSHHQASCIFFLLSVSVERAVASYYLSDYEQSTRPYISILIICVSMLFSTGYSLIFALNFFTFLASSLSIVLITATSIGLYSFVYYYNTRVKKLNDSSRTAKFNYSLATRFQTMENLSSLKMAKWVVTTHAVYVFICQVCLMCAYFGMETTHWEIFVYITDSVVYYSNMIIVTLVLLSVPKWRSAFLKPCLAEEFDPEANAKRVAEVYFQHLGKAWS